MVAVFLVELILKLFGLGFKGYIKDPYNRFDAIIVITSFVDLVLYLMVKDDGPVKEFTSILVAARTLRLLKLARYN